MRKIIPPFIAVLFIAVTAFTPSREQNVSLQKVIASPGCADVQLGISYIVPSFPGPAYITVDVTWNVSQGNSSKGILLLTTGGSPIALSVSQSGQRSFYFTVPSGTYFTATAIPFSSPHPEKGKECSEVVLSVDIPT
jgi:hypothetical protein